MLTMLDPSPDTPGVLRATYGLRLSGTFELKVTLCDETILQKTISLGRAAAIAQDAALLAEAEAAGKPPPGEPPADDDGKR